MDPLARPFLRDVFSKITILGVWEPLSPAWSPPQTPPDLTLFGRLRARLATPLARYYRRSFRHPGHKSSVPEFLVPSEKKMIYHLLGGGLGCRFGSPNPENADFLGGPSLTFGRLQVSIVSMPRLMRFWTPKLLLNWPKIDIKINLNQNPFFPCFRHRFWIDFWQIFN